MQRANCKVRIGGNLGMVCPKENVTPAEIVVLKAIHGEDAVIEIESTKMDKTGHADELNRLRDEYTVRLDGSGELLVDKLFPGARPQLPVTLKDIGVEAGAAKPKKGGNPNPQIDPVEVTPLTDDDLLPGPDED